jgi:hypothetical protein
MNGSVSLVGGHMDYFYECEVCGKKDGYERADGRNICDRCYANLENKEAFLTYLFDKAFDKDFEKKVNDLMTKFAIAPEHASCYLVNYGDISICLASGGCRNLAICNEINKEEK